jgi:hypothetical protein
MSDEMPTVPVPSNQPVPSRSRSNAAWLLLIVVLGAAGAIGTLVFMDRAAHSRASEAAKHLRRGMTYGEVVEVTKATVDTRFPCWPSSGGGCQALTLEFHKGPYSYIIVVWFDADSRVDRIEPVSAATG